ncbi:phytanoyl-CoA dioxygenase [Actinoplanes ianthinogenes]|uniref:Phytanoyl-CoA dioxygenase n=1 Tax=Actinoplanes ianthinogenes TaxID=122358 RepID=A0ABM7LP90_9ACTN|nr:phytanoyl-CoA dioxygenase [Actinoplanes ianthinogenes]BCJ41097.1 phytanoyl-CoA dioxygenase [Actinoplanes ianthinogenes]GGR22929.1 phytanoyl-CoA dioxygenase [Actinoplanes ianthinogenes]
MDVDGFVRDGYTVVRGAFDADTAAGCREIIWARLGEHGVRAADRGTWRPPLIRINTPEGEPFRRAASSPELGAAYDELIGPGRWAAHPHVGGTIPVRFPSEEYPGEVGWHIEGSWWGGSEYWANVHSKARGLLALFLFSDVGPDDAPTRLILGSHRYAAAALATRGEPGMPGGDVPSLLRPSTFCRTTAEATGAAGDVYLCHPFIVHTATWPHRGAEPRMMAQPAVLTEGFAIDGSDPSPVARAIVDGLADTSQLRTAG